MKTVISAVQPTGSLHIGNYLGSIQRWLSFQDKYKCFFSIVDLHAMTASFPATQLFKEHIYHVLSVYLASGLDSNKVVIFQQSDVSCHAELFWILSCFTQLGKLNRMTQFKDKSGKNKEKACLGLYSYPVLMAADILLYDANIVPVGEDQLQHIELTNDIVASFNHKYSEEIFCKVEALLPTVTKRIMSLRNGTKKMSKSDISDMTRINLTDSKELIKSKILKAKTDMMENLEENLENRPEIRNLLNLFSAFSGKSILDIQSSYNSKGFKALKEDLADLIIAKIVPISLKIQHYLSDKAFLDEVLRDGSIKASFVAEKKLKTIKQVIGVK